MYFKQLFLSHLMAMTLGLKLTDVSDRLLSSCIMHVHVDLWRHEIENYNCLKVTEKSDLYENITQITAHFCV